MARTDTQRRKLYKWEGVVLEPTRGMLAYRHRVPMHLAETVERFLREIWGDLGYPNPPTVRIMRQRSCGAYFSSGNEIRLSKSHAISRSRWYVAHEAAHAIIEQLGQGRSVPPHGPEFCGVYALLLSRYCDLDEFEVRESMESHDLKVASPEAVYALVFGVEFA